MKFAKYLIFFTVLGFAFSVQAKEPLPRFFKTGDGTVYLRQVKSGKELKITYLSEDGKPLKQAFEALDRFFGWPASHGEHISYRLIAYLDHYSDRFAKGKKIHITSSYRSPNYNASLRKKGRNAARTSTHIDGMAVDFYLETVDGHHMWETIRHEDCCGVGHYGGRVVHLDSGRPRFWQSHTSKTKTKASAFNRYIYLSAEYDRYRVGETMRLFFTSISDFGFGVVSKVKFVDAHEPRKTLARAKLKTPQQSGDCLKVNSRKDARFLYVEVPKKLKKQQKFRVRVDFCNAPFAEMPEQTLSGIMEVMPLNKKKGSLKKPPL